MIEDSRLPVVIITPKVAEAASKAGIDVHDFYMRHYGATVRIEDGMIPLTAENEEP